MYHGYSVCDVTQRIITEQEGHLKLKTETKRSELCSNVTEWVITEQEGHPKLYVQTTYTVHDKLVHILL